MEAGGSHPEIEPFVREPGTLPRKGNDLDVRRFAGERAFEELNETRIRLDERQRIRAPAEKLFVAIPVPGPISKTFAPVANPHRVVRVSQPRGE